MLDHKIAGGDKYNIQACEGRVQKCAATCVLLRPIIIPIHSIAFCDDEYA